MERFGQLDYWKFNREEAQRTALFFSSILYKENLNIFLNWLKEEKNALPADFTIVPEEVRAYFEYAYLRDYWHGILNDKKDMEQSNIQKYGFISKCLASPGILWDSNDCPSDFNKNFISRQNVSKKHIESPSNWNLSRLAETFKDCHSFMDACLLKWAFNAKPDIVIHTSRTSVVCVEVKFCSEEGQYPQSAEEKKVFDKKSEGLRPRVRQTEVQKHMLSNILGFDFCGVFLCKSPLSARTTDFTAISWDEVSTLMINVFDLGGFRTEQFDILFSGRE